MIKNHCTAMRKKRAAFFCTAAIFVHVLLAIGMASAATQTDTLTGSHALTEDLNIALNVSSDSDKSAILAGNGDSIIGGDGVKVSVDIPDIGDRMKIYYWIMADGGTVSIDKYYFDGGAADTSAKAAQIGIRAKEGGQVTIGDNAEIYANSNGSSIIASGSGSSVTIGDNAKLYGTTSNNGSGTIAAAENNTPSEGAGKIIIGDNAYIINDGYMSSSGSNHIAVNANGYTEIASITIGKEAQIYAQGSGSNNYAIHAGDCNYGTRGTVEVGEKARIATSGDYSHALHSSNIGSLISLDKGADITTHGEGSAAAQASGGGAIYVGDGASLLTEGSNASGIYALGLGKGSFLWPDESLLGTSVIETGSGVMVETLDSGKGVVAESRDGYGAVVKLGENNTIITNGDDNAYGLYASGSKAGITAGNGLIIRTAGNKAHGVRVYDGASVNTLGTTITTDGNVAHGVYITRSSDIYIGDGSTISTNGSGSHGIYAFDKSIVEAGRVEVTTRGTNSLGVQADTNCRISIGADSVITTYESGSTALLASKSFVELGEGSEITTHGKNSKGVGSYGVGAETILHDGVTIRTYGNNAAGIDAIQYGTVDAGRVSITTSGDNSSGLNMFRGSIVSLDAGSAIKTEGKNSYGIVAMEDVYLDLGAGAVIGTAGESAYGVYLMDGGTVNMAGATIKVDTEKTGYAIVAQNATVLCGQDSLIKGDGIFNILGNITAQDFSGYSAAVDLVMRDTSIFTGATKLFHDNCFINLSFVGSDSLWQVTGNSKLTNLELDAAAVDLRHCDSVGSVITVENLNADKADKGGIFFMETNVPALNADKLVITGTAQGSHQIHVENSGGDSVTGDELITLVEMRAGETAEFTLRNVVELGAWQYGLRRVSDGAAQFLSGGDIYELYAVRDSGGSSSSGSGAVNSFAGSYLMAYAETQTLIQRMGDLRQSPYDQGVWFRAHGGKFESNSKSYVRGFDMDYGGVQIGYDRKIENKWDGDVYAGVMFGYSKGDLDYFHNGEGSVDSKTLGIYGIYVRPNGFYVDAVLKYQWMTNDFDVIDTAGTMVRGQDIDTGGLGFSLEIGQRLRLGEGKANGAGWYVEPQVQFTYQHQDGGYFSATNGLHIGVDAFTSLLGRVGILAGYETDKTNFYAKVSRVKEFDGDLTIRANGVPIDESFGDSWWVYGVGFTTRINDRNSLYLDLERTSGGSFSQPWRINGGWRLEF